MFRARTDSPSSGAADRITDFDRDGNDTIDLSAVFGAQLSFVGDDAFTASGQVRINDIAGADVLIEINTGGSPAPDMVIRLERTSIGTIVAGDFACSASQRAACRF